jgi:MFS family permease
VLAPLRHRDFRLLWTGMSASLVGDGVLLVALAWQVYSLSGDPQAMSSVGFALSLSHVATLLFGGVLSDRVDRRTLMLISDVVRGGCLVALAALALTDTVEVWHIIGLVACYGAASGLFGPRSTRSCRPSSPPPTCSGRTRSTSSCARSRSRLPARPSAAC